MYVPVYALDGYYSDQYNVGDKFKLVKNAYKYIKKERFLMPDTVEKDPDYEDSFYFTTGEVVKYTGSMITNGAWIDVHYYMEVESSDGKRKGYIDALNIEPWDLKRPQSIEDFISKYSVESIKSETALWNKVEPYYTNLATLFNNGLLLISPKVTKDELDREKSSLMLEYDSETSMSMAKERYNDSLILGVEEESDSRFMMKAYYYAYIYCNMKKGIDSDKDKTPEERFKEALADINDDSKSDAEKLEALAKLKNSYEEMDEEEKEKYKEDYKKANLKVGEESSNNTQESNDAIEQIEDSIVDILYKKPGQTSKGTSSDNLEDMMNDAEKFIDKGGEGAVKTEDFKEPMAVLYNIALEIGVALSVIVGLIIGIKFMLGSVEEKAEIKKLLIPYVAGCVVVFGGFGIWKFVITLMQSV